MRPSRTVTVSLPPELAKKIDRAARSEGRTRSELVREAMRQYLTRHDRWERIFEYGEKAAQRSRVTEAKVADIVKRARRSRKRP